MPFSLPANFNPGDSYTNVHANNVAAAINTLVNGPAKAFVATSENTTSTTYADLATTTDQVTVTIGQSGAALVSLSIGAAYASTVSGAYYCSFAVSGANTIAAGSPYEMVGQTSTGTGGTTITPMCGTFLVTGLVPGATTFKLKYKAGSGATATYNARTIVVVPFP
jgi:hypothetical protein